MATYTKETALYDTGAIANDIQEAGTTATNFLSADSSGIMIYDGSNGVQTPSNPDADTNNVFIDSDSLDIRKGTDVLATFSAEETRVGSYESSNIRLEGTGISAKKSDGSEYFNVGIIGNEQQYVSVSKDDTGRGAFAWLTGSGSDEDFINLHSAIASGGVFGVSLKITVDYNTSSSDHRYSGTSTRTYKYEAFNKGTSYTYTKMNSSPNIEEARIIYSTYPNTNIWCVDASVNSAFLDWYFDYGWRYARVVLKMYATVNTTAPAYSFGINTGVSKKLGFAIGNGTIPSEVGLAMGKYNVQDTNDDYALIIGNGSNDNNRSDALTVDWNGNIDAAGGIAIDGNITAGGTISAANNAFTVNSSGNVNTSGNVTATGTINAANGAFIVDSSGNVRTSRGITVWNHASQIGDRVQKEGGTDWTTNVTSSADAWIQLGNISLTIGRWIIVARARFTPTSSGNHYSSINISTTNKLEAVRDRRYGTGTYYNQHSTSMILSLASDATVYVNGMASVAGTWTRTNNSAFTIDAIRIM